jgi:hypothetical protein
LVRSLGIALAVAVVLAILNPILREFDSIPFPFSIVFASLRWLSGCGAGFLVPIFLALIVAAIAHEANKTRIK